MIRFSSEDFGAFVFGSEIFRKNPVAEIEFCVKIATNSETGGFLERDFWEIAIREILDGKTRFGRIGIFFDRKNFAGKRFFSNFNFSAENFSPIDRRRAEKFAKIEIFETQILREMANEGMSDSVEFRRLARKFLRKAKCSRIDTILFGDAIFGEGKTRKILQKIAGTQLRCLFLADWTSAICGDFEKINRGTVKITTGDDKKFTRTIAERILRRRLGKTEIQAI